MATLRDTTKVMAYLVSLYPRFQLPAATIKAYHTILKDLPAEAMTSAAEKLAADSKWFPAASEIRQTAFDLMQGDELPLAIEGWAQLQKSFQGGSTEYHPLTLKTISALGGRRKLGMTTDSELPFLRAQFIKTYDTYRNREVEDRRQLPSVTEYKRLQANNIGEQFKQLADRLNPNKGDDPNLGELDY